MLKVHADMAQDHVSMALGQISNYPWCPSKINTWDVHEDPKTMFIRSISILIWYRIHCLVDIDSPKTIAMLGYCISCVAWLLYWSSWLYILCFSISLGVLFYLVGMCIESNPTLDAIKHQDGPMDILYYRVTGKQGTSINRPLGIGMAQMGLLCI